VSWATNRPKRAPKFSPGEVITSAAQLRSLVEARRWVFLMGLGHRKGRAYHAGWICNMQFRCVMSYIENGWLRIADRNPDYFFVFEAKAHQHPLLAFSTWFGSCGEIPDSDFNAADKDHAWRCALHIARKHAGRQDVKIQVNFVSDELPAPAFPEPIPTNDPDFTVVEAGGKAAQ
jgi:hypothetical protein